MIIPLEKDSVIAKMAEKRVEKLIWVNTNNQILGLSFLKDYRKFTDQKYANLNVDGKLMVGGAVGANKDYLERSQALINQGCDVLVVDIANGHS